MRRVPGVLAVAALALAACSPQAPKGVSKDALDTAINGAVGDPNTCVLIGQASSGRVVYQYGTHVTCGKEWPPCGGKAHRTVDDLLKSTAQGATATQASCASNVEGSRWVGWAAGPIEGRPDLVYAAAMEGTATPPGVVVADKLKAALKAAGL